MLWLLASQCKSPQLNIQQPDSASLLLLDSSYKNTDSEATALIAPYKKALDSQMNAVIGYSLVDLYKQRPEGPLGNWAADAVYWQAKAIKKADFVVSMLNHGGLRTDVASGPITLGKIYEIMPFDNELVLIGLNKEQLKSIVALNLAKGGDPIAGLKIIANCDTGNAIIVNGIEIEDIDSNAIIWLATSDYMANGGDDYSLLEKIPNRVNTGMLIRNNLLNYLQFYSTNNLSIDNKIEGRITICK